MPELHQVACGELVEELLKNPNPSSRACLSIRAVNHPCVCCLSASASAKFRVKFADESGLRWGCDDA